MTFRIHMEGVQGEGRLQGWGAPTGLRAVFGASVNTNYEHPGAAFEGLPWNASEGCHPQGLSLQESGPVLGGSPGTHQREAKWASWRKGPLRCFLESRDILVGRGQSDGLGGR